jgi:hypothetical protein
LIDGSRRNNPRFDQTLRREMEFSAASRQDLKRMYRDVVLRVPALQRPQKRARIDEHAIQIRSG